MTGNPHRSYYPALDGLRGVAILLVVIYHNFGFISQSHFGWLGVDLFFVLSGFLITGILLKTVDKPGFLSNFYMRRVLRIFPLYYLSLLIFLFVLPPFTSERIHWDYYIDNQVYFWTYIQNWLFIFKEPGNAQILNHYWSLAVEEQFYIFWPLVMLLLKKPKRLLIFISILLLAVIAFRFGLWIYRIENLAYYNLYTFTRIDGICIGCITALLYHINYEFIRKYTSLIVIAFAGVNFLFYFINSISSYSFPYIALVGYTTFAMMFGLLVYEAARGETRLINYIFTLPVFRFLGKISYALYVFHWPVYLLLFYYWPLSWSSGISKFGNNILVAILATIISIIISWLSTRYFESHFLRLKHKYA